MTTNEMAHVIPGDTVILTIKGKVADPAVANTPLGTVVRAFRPHDGSAYSFTGAPSAIRVDLVLDHEATVEYEIVSKFKNGIWIDDRGRYWMRRPDGWHEMTVKPAAVPSILGTQFAPPGVQRLQEDKSA